MAARKKRTSPTKRKRTKNQGSIFTTLLGCCLFIALGAAAVVGWWPQLLQHEVTKPVVQVKRVAPTSPAARQQVQTARSAQTAKLAQPPQKAAPTLPHPKRDEIRDLITVGSIAPAVVTTPPHGPKPQAKPPSPDLSKTTLPVVPYKEDKTLPPTGKFALDNAAHKVVAKEEMVVFAEKTTGSKAVATLKMGQEMRVYERDGNWQRIVVPSTDIIGWIAGSVGQ